MAGSQSTMHWDVIPGISLITGENVSESVCSRLIGRYPVVVLLNDVELFIVSACQRLSMPALVI